MRARRALLATLLALLAGCSVRERANPFDPGNPDTGGTPVGFVALAGSNRVTLRWQPVIGEQLVGYQVFRKTAAETTYRAVTAVLDPRTTGTTDFALANGIEHAYRLFYVLPSGLAPRYAEDVATPGHALPWIVDAGRGVLARLTPDGRRVAFERTGFSAPTAVASDTTDGRVWVSDNLGGSVTSFDPSTGVAVTIPGLSSPGTIAVNPGDHSGWVCDERQNLIHHFTPAGDPATLPIAPLARPIGVAVDPTDGGVLICERDGNRVRRHHPGGPLLWTRTVDAPSRVAVDRVRRDAWVTSFETGRVTRLGLDGTVLDVVDGFSGPIGIAVDSRRGLVWVTEALAGRVTVVTLDGDVQFRISGIPETRDVSVDPETGDGWVVAPGSGEVLRLSSDGAVLRRLGGFDLPYGITLDPGVR
ncbi:MAG TPA: hypothetical protein VEY91_05085 [Candidatus Limnocylindria bacterium]|nr:hypothetical protein [Candidatus Limnocylindria bacterium]